MGRYQYSVVRCVPEPRTGEFINVGAIVGSAEERDWDARAIQSFRRANKLCGPEQIGAATEFIAEVTQIFSKAKESSDPIPDSWLNEVWSEKRNVVQLSEPQVAVGESASEVLDFVFATQLRQAESASPRSLAALRRAIRRFLNRFNSPGTGRPGRKSPIPSETA
jgi:hypothetical protein